ncbi:MAG: TonB-dependent receptor plug domain-containing protein, partial [Leptolyngbya sp. SIO4C5]|nr:TonB-dependent receptor plug domain-containing protein [Leptolyngbya sp. SIO4C5]
MKQFGLGRLGLGLLPLSVLAWALPAGADALAELTEQPEEATAAIASLSQPETDTSTVATTLDSLPEAANPGASEAVTADSTVINVADIDPATQPAAETAPALTVSDWLTQETSAAVAITAVQVQETTTGLSVIIEADEPLAVGASRTVGNALIIEIPNSVLDLTNADQAEQFGPAPGIALVSVTELPDGSVQVSITGNDAPPEVSVGSEGGNLVLGVVPGLAIAGAGDSDAIRIGVEGEQAGSDYVVPNASTATRTDTPLRDIPQSIQVIPEAVLEDQGVIRLNDALRNVSGVVSSSLDQRGQDFIVRGFSGSTVLRDGVRLTPGGGNFGFQELS